MKDTKLAYKCATEDCNRVANRINKTLCEKHYLAAWKRGEIGSDRPKCSIEECEKLSYANTFCRFHYERWYKYKDPLHISRYTIGTGASHEERFWSKVKINDDNKCWEWQGNITKYGYGQSWLENKPQQAHRLAWFFTHGRWPYDILRHKCDNRPCCNVNHLLEGSHQDNENDKVERNRQAKGETVGTSVLKNLEVMEIKRRLRNNDTQSQIARDFGVSQTTIWHINNEDYWKHIKLEDYE